MAADSIVSPHSSAFSRLRTGLRALQAKGVRNVLVSTVSRRLWCLMLKWLEPQKTLYIYIYYSMTSRSSFETIACSQPLSQNKGRFGMGSVENDDVPDVPFGVLDKLYLFFGCSKTLSEIQSEPDID